MAQIIIGYIFIELSSVRVLPPCIKPHESNEGYLVWFEPL